MNSSNTGAATTASGTSQGSALRYELAVATRASGGLLGNLVNSVTSGEGMVLRFSGRGKVLICSRNREAFVAWMMSHQSR
jgi:uncharacterized protein (AIM24 family)